MDTLNLLKQSFSQILCAKREELNYSQEEMAEKCCISTRQYLNLEHGLNLPTFQTLVNISIVFEVNFDIFLSLIIEQGYNVMDKSGFA
ncbi:MAG: helix-turn-helix transcriptional regulator [Clostridia bacterium]|nr:helix-turn-helix transcriptional regulator [Clostridia bacterium]